MTGPLDGLRVIELAGIGPAPFACMLLADMGAEVVRVQRPGPGNPLVDGDEVLRGRRSVTADLKTEAGAATVLDLVDAAGVLVEAFRPGAAERLGVGPDVCFARNPRLVYARMTGWGQDGPLAQAAGRDINYTALAGAFGAAPTPGLVGDFPAGMLLCAGILAALHAGGGQVVDVSVLDAAALSTTTGRFLAGAGHADLLTGGAPFYDAYATRDGARITFGALDPGNYAELLEALGLPPVAQFDRAAWPDLRERIAAVVAARTREEWQAALEGTDVCFAPVLSFEEAAAHPHNVARGTFTRPAPRFSRAAA